MGPSHIPRPSPEGEGEAPGGGRGGAPDHFRGTGRRRQRLMTSQSSGLVIGAELSEAGAQLHLEILFP